MMSSLEQWNGYCPISQGEKSPSMKQVRFFSHLQLGPSHLSFSLYNKPYKIPFTWLRDHCPCSQCIQPSTRQKTIHLISPDIQPLSVSTLHTDGSLQLKIQWKNHTSIYDQDLFQDPSPAVPPKVYWTAQQDPLIQSYSTFLHTPKPMIQQLYTHGLAFIKNIPQDQRNIETLASYFGIIKETFYGKTWDVKSIKAAKNIAYTNVYLGFHMDLL
jgi:gamma-butyrobetaine dioxygenase